MRNTKWSRVTIGVSVEMILCCATLTAQTNTFPSSGNVGIGTTSPSTPLDVQGPIGEDDNYDHSELGQNGWGGSHTIAFGAYQGGSAAGQSDVTGWFQNFQSAGPYSYGPALMEYVANGGEWNFLIGPASPGAGQNVVWGTPVLTLIRGGNVGIGTMTPAQNLKQLNSSGVLVPYTTTGPVLEVAGTIAFSTGQGGGILFPDGTIQSTAFGPSNCSTLSGGDYAESIDVTGEKTQYEPGDVMVIDPLNPGHFLKSSEPYSTLIAGIYSTKPGFVGRRQTTDPKTIATEIPMAMVGIVPTKVSAENGPIKVGDLLVTSSTLGYAMKGTDRTRVVGAVVGKALGTLESGNGVVEVLVSLQ